MKIQYIDIYILIHTRYCVNAVGQYFANVTHDSEEAEILCGGVGVMNSLKFLHELGIR